jgi:hypothetical protein
MSPVRTSLESPWQNGIAERWVRSCRRDLLDHVIAIRVELGLKQVKATQQQNEQHSRSDGHARGIRDRHGYCFLILHTGCRPTNQPGALT